MVDCDIKFVDKEITPFGGLSLFFKMLERCHFQEQLTRCGIPLQGSNRGYNPLQLILGLFAGVWCGASCFGHLDAVRYDIALCKLLGWRRGADHRAYQRYLNKFTQAVNQRVFGELYRWFFSQLVFDNYTLDFDSTVMVREGSQQGAAKGYNPKRPGRPSHNPLMAFPCVVEQAKLNKFVSLLDERIAIQSKIIEDLKKLKSAVIEKLYSKIQGKEYSFGQLFEVVNERNKQMEYSNILSASQEKGMVNRDDLNLDIQFERSNINTYKIVRAGDYVIHLRSFQGGFAFSDKLGVCSPAYTILRPNSLLEYGYLSYYFTSRRFIKSLIIVTYGIRDGRSINVEEWLSMKVVIPPKEHQLHTLKVLKCIDDRIVNEETYATCLANQKQYLLRQMFI